MKLTESEIKHLIDEEIQAMIDSGEIDEGILDRLKARASGLGTKIKGAAQGMVTKGAGKAVSALGSLGAGDVAKAKGAELEKGGADIKAATANKVLVKKTESIMDSHIKDLKNDLKKLGLKIGEDEEFSKALRALQNAVTGFTSVRLQQRSRRAGA